jgi:hypothetical protein
MAALGRALAREGELLDQASALLEQADPGKGDAHRSPAR